MTTIYRHGESRSISASLGLACSTTRAFLAIPPKTSVLRLRPRNFSTAVVVKYALNPWLLVLKTTDALATAPTDYSVVAQDGDAATHVVISSLDTLANGDFLLVGAHRPFGGVWVDMDTEVNGTTSVLTVSYWNGTAWVDTADTDGTISGGKTFAQDGTVTWAVPAAWARARLVDIYTTPPYQYGLLEYYWTRWEVSVALDSSTLVDQMLAIAAQGVPAELTDVVGDHYEQLVRRGPGGEGSLQAATDAGTANLVVTGFAAEGQWF